MQTKTKMAEGTKRKKWEEQILKLGFRTWKSIKIPDAPMTGNKICDSILDNGQTFYLEWKDLDVSKTVNYFNPKSIFRPHQIRELNEIEDMSLRNYKCAFGMCGKKISNRIHIYIIPAKALKQDRIYLKDYEAYSLEGAVKFFCPR